MFAMIASYILSRTLVPTLAMYGQDFFPNTDSGEFILHVRGKTGMRIEEAARLADLVETSIRSKIPSKELNNILDNLGLPYSPLNTMHSTSGIIGASDGDVMVTLNETITPQRTMFAICGRRSRANFRERSFTFFPQTLRHRFLTSVYRPQSTYSCRATTSQPAPGKRQHCCSSCGRCPA